MTAAYSLLRSERRTLELSISPLGQLTVRAPLKASEAYISAFVESKSGWIAEKLEELERRGGAGSLFELRQGGFVTLLGERYELRLSDINRPGLYGDSFVLSPLPEEGHEAELETVYRGLAAEYLAERCRLWSREMGADYKSLRISGAKSRWASCSSRGALSFSWRLLTASRQTVDYVVIHELAHRFELNHSAGFWAIVKSFCPEFKAGKEELRTLRIRLAREPAQWG